MSVADPEPQERAEAPPRPLTPGTAREAASPESTHQHGGIMSARSTARTAYPSDAASCGGCDARWTALGAAHCAGCHRTFSGLRLFDAHRHARGDRGGCTDPETLPGIEYRDGMWRGPAMTDAERDRTRTAS